MAAATGAAGAIVAVDQLTKTWALETLDDRSIHVIWTLRLELTFNTGAAFGLGRGLAPLLAALAVVVLVVFVGSARALLGSRVATLGLGFVVGGAVGNLVDRLVRGHDGAVIDFIDLQWWPVFNVADMAVSTGAVLLVLVGTAQRPRPVEDHDQPRPVNE